MKVIITVGLPACGKSTLAARLEKRGWYVLERDRIRREISLERQEEFHWGSWHLIDEEEVSHRWELRLWWHLNQGTPVIISDTNLNPRRRRELVDKLKARGCQVTLVLFDVPVDELRRRNAVRGPLGVEDHAFTLLYPKWKLARARFRKEGMIRVSTPAEAEAAVA